MISSHKSPHKKKLLYIQGATLIGSSLIFLFKITAYFITHSNGILSDALESLVNIGAGAMALFSVWWSSHPKDLSHPYGHGKIEFLTSGIEGTLIALAGLLIIFKSLGDIFLYEHTVTQIKTGLEIVIISMGINLAMALILIYTGKKYQSLAMEADGRHLLSDVYTSIGLVGGLVLLHITQLVFIDNLIALLFAFILIVEGYKLIRKALRGILDEVNLPLLTEVVQFINQHRKNTWIDLHHFKFIQNGPSLHIDAHLSLPRYLSLEEVHSEIKKIETLLQEKYGNTLEIFIHTDPCKDTQCTLCSTENCPIRKNPFQKHIPWTTQNVILNQQHSLEETKSLPKD